MAKKLDPEFVRGQFAIAGYEMLGEYVNGRTPIKFRCPVGHEHQIVWDSFQGGARCGKCARNTKKTTEFVKEQFALSGYEMFGEYVNSTTPIKFRCPNGHDHQINWNDFNSGYRCGKCARNIKKTTEFIKERFALSGYEMLGEYVNAIVPIKFRCPEGHEHQINWNSFEKGVRCGMCSETAKKTTEFVKEQFALNGYEMFGEYVEATTPIKFRCPEGHEHQISWDSFDRGSRCGVCYTKKFNSVDWKTKAFNRMTNSIKCELRRQDLVGNWRDLYDESFVRNIAMSINVIYSTCPQGCAVDHIVPVSWFNLTRPEELIACWSLENLRHLDAIKNLKRRNVMTEEEIAYMKAHHSHIFFAASKKRFRLKDAFAC